MNSNVVRNSVPFEGAIVSDPPVGGEFVLIQTDATEPPHDTKKLYLEPAVNEFGEITKLAIELNSLFAKKLVVVDAAVVKLNVASSMNHLPQHVDSVLIEAVKVNFLSETIFCKAVGLLTIDTMGTSSFTTKMSIDLADILKPAETFTVHLELTLPTPRFAFAVIFELFER